MSWLSVRTPNMFMLQSFCCSICNTMTMNRNVPTKLVDRLQTSGAGKSVTYECVYSRSYVVSRSPMVPRLLRGRCRTYVLAMQRENSTGNERTNQWNHLWQPVFPPAVLLLFAMYSIVREALVYFCPNLQLGWFFVLQKYRCDTRTNGVAIAMLNKFYVAIVCSTWVTDCQDQPLWCQHFSILLCIQCGVLNGFKVWMPVWVKSVY